MYVGRLCVSCACMYVQRAALLYQKTNNELHVYRPNRPIIGSDMDGLRNRSIRRRDR